VYLMLKRIRVKLQA